MSIMSDFVKRERQRINEREYELLDEIDRLKAGLKAATVASDPIEVALDTLTGVDFRRESE
jgi:hypothetical protein